LRTFTPDVQENRKPLPTPKLILVVEALLPMLGLVRDVVSKVIDYSVVVEIRVGISELVINLAMAR
jgi:hypothetical protein